MCDAAIPGCAFATAAAALTVVPRLGPTSGFFTGAGAAAASSARTTRLARRALPAGSGNQNGMGWRVAQRPCWATSGAIRSKLDAGDPHGFREPSERPEEAGPARPTGQQRALEGQGGRHSC